MKVVLAVLAILLNYQVAHAAAGSIPKTKSLVELTVPKERGFDSGERLIGQPASGFVWSLDASGQVTKSEKKSPWKAKAALKTIDELNLAYMNHQKRSPHRMKQVKR